MPAIEKDRYFTILMDFEVEPDQQQALIDGIAEQVELYFRHDPAFVSISFHASEDGLRVVNYAQWRSRQAWAWAPTGPDAPASAAIRAVLDRCGGRRVGLDFFSVAGVVEAAAA